MNELWVLQIEWDHEHWSPPIGPFRSYSEAKRAAVEARKRLKANDKPYQSRVHLSQIRSMWTMRGWLPIEGDERLAGAVERR